VTGCPVNINPAGILEAAQAGDPAAADRCGIESCIECGICSYVCPSYLPLLAGIRTMRP
jgi:electron transport complex protein RnfC